MKIRPLILPAALCVPSLAAAHVMKDQGGGFVSGLAHPVSGLDHVLAMVAVGLWGAQLGEPAVWLLPVAFPLIMAVGGFLGLIGVPLPAPEIAIALSAVGLGAAVLCAWRPDVKAATGLVGLFGLFHGYAHGVELPRGADAVLYSAGFVLATGLLHLLGVGLGLFGRFKGGALAVRAAGALVLAGGGVFLVRALS